MDLSHTFTPDAMVTVPLDLIALQITSAAQSALIGTQWKENASVIPEL